MSITHSMADRRREIAEQVIADATELEELTSEGGPVAFALMGQRLREAASLLGARQVCATCRHWDTIENLPPGFGACLNEQFPIPPAAARVMAVCVTSNTFGCNLHVPAPPVAAPSEPTA